MTSDDAGYAFAAMTHTVQIEVSDETLAALQRDPRGYAAELRVAAAAKLYEVGRVSQELAAEIAGLSRADFMRAISQLRVSPFHDTRESLKDEERTARLQQFAGRWIVLEDDKVVCDADTADAAARAARARGITIPYLLFVEPDSSEAARIGL